MESTNLKNGQEYRSFIGRKRIFVFALLAFTVLVFLFAIAFGSSTVPLDRVIATLFGHGAKKENIIVLNLRLPRAVTAVVAGFGLGIVGCVMQGILRNPLASASTIGVSQGAAFGAAFAIIALGGGLMSASTAGAQLSVTSPAVTTVCAFIGSMMSTLFIVGLSRFRSISAGTLILAGVALSSLFSAGTTLLESVFDYSLMGKQTVITNKICAKNCETNADCNEAGEVECIEKDNAKFCYNRKNFEFMNRGYSVKQFN